MLDLDGFLRHAVESRASDLHLKVGARPFVRVDGALTETRFDVLEPADTERVVAVLMPPARAEELRRRCETHFVHGVAGLGRFRVSAFRQRGRVGLVLRRVLPGIPGLEALGLPPGVAMLAAAPDGLAMVTGLSGSGRTSTLAAMIDQVNQRATKHIITIEEPIEVLHPDKRSIVNQREVGLDTDCVRSAVEDALRQDPDVIVIGELRDGDTARVALEAAAVGYLVLATMSAVTVTDAVGRLLDLFPHAQRDPLQALLARCLRGVICQRLLPRAGGRGRIPAVELLMANAPISDRLASGALADLDAHVRDGDFYGMQTFDQSLLRLYSRGLVERDVVLAHASYAPALRIELESIDRERGTRPSAPPVASAPAARPPVAVSS